MKTIRFFAISLAIFGLAVLFPSGRLLAQTSRLGPFSLAMARISDDVWLFEIKASEGEANLRNLSLMAAPNLSLTPIAAAGGTAAAGNLSVRLSQNPPSLTIQRGDQKLFTLSPYAPDGQLAGLSFNGDYSHLAGLGADFTSGSQAFNLVGDNVLPATVFGNGRITMFGSRPNQVQIPVIYALGEGQQCAALFVDEVRPLQWNLSGRPWTVSTAGPLGPELGFRFFVIGGDSLADLRSRFMEISGRPPVPPIKALGVWAIGLSGANEAERRERAAHLKNTVPGLSGLVVSEPNDLEATKAVAKALDLKLMVDESAYLSQESPHYTDLARRSFLTRQSNAGGPITVVSHNNAPSAIIDYTNGAASDFWHSLERINQVTDGVSFFRLTDGDLPATSSEIWHQGADDGDSHSHYAWNNIFPLKWQEGVLKSVAAQRLRFRPRLFLLNRSGLAGLGRLSGALYNGEASIFLFSSHLGVRGHLALSGIDYYSSDISHNLPARPVDQNAALYDSWLAKTCLTDIPLLLPEELLLQPTVRYNLSLREALGPYYYSLAWEAHLNGRPLLAPLAYYFQDDVAARSRTGEMMLGSGLLLGLDFDGAAERGNIYVPAGQWYNWRTGEMIQQEQGGLVTIDLKDSGQLTPPILARAGAIIPAVEEVALKGGLPERIPAIKIFIGETSTEFTWYEDDGLSRDYQSRNAYGKTVISAVTNLDGSTVVTIKAREGSWEGAPNGRRLLVDIYGPSAPGEATLDGLPHNRVARSVELDQLESGWAAIGSNRIRFKTPPLESNVDHVLWFK